MWPLTPDQKQKQKVKAKNLWLSTAHNMTEHPSLERYEAAAYSTESSWNERRKLHNDHFFGCIIHL